MTDLESLAAIARAWQLLDPDPATRAEVDRLLEADDRAGLESRFGSRLTFGTAGLRGELGAGPNRMNRMVVAQTSAGVGAFLRERSAEPTAVVGYDARHNSAVFARDAAEVLSAAGVTVTLLPRALPTPVLAFAVRDLDASAGVMITASHNPAADNGYKLYLGDADAGSQLVPPSDGRVLDHIDRIVAGGRMPARSAAYRVADEGVIDRYVAATAAVADARGELTWVYTPMHGVGADTALRVVEAAGLPAPLVVAAQRDPDPDFPTVAFPNPEEPGALDLAVQTANEVGARLILANDPDADRLAVAVPISDGWQRLSGNEVGMLLAWSTGQTAVHTDGSFATSIVSTPGLAAIAAHFGLTSVETLTGFKWISRAPGLRFGFEEALGYLVDPDVVRDKDGISALVAVLHDVLALQAEGRTLRDRLDEIAMTVGAHASAQVSVRVIDTDEIDRMMGRLRSRPPESIGGLAVLAADDLLSGDGGLPASDVLRYTLHGGARVIVRPSGTEPKLKVYLDAVSDAGTLSARTAAATATVERLRAGIAELLGEGVSR